MLTAGRPQYFQPQKPAMKIDILHRQPPLAGDIGLYEFVGERSWLMFDRMDIDTAWMQHPPSDWPASPAFMVFKERVDQLHVVNDCAERSVKDVTEFINYAKDPARLDRIMMVVNHHRQILDLDHLTKAQMDNMDDFLQFIWTVSCTVCVISYEEQVQVLLCFCYSNHFCLN